MFTKNIGLLPTKVIDRGGRGYGLRRYTPPPGLYQNPYSPVSGDTSQLCEVVGGIILSPPRHHPGDTSQAVEIG